MKKHIHTVILATLTILIATTIGIFQPKRASAAQRCFVETNQCMDGRIAEFWEQNGGLAVFGYPIGPQEQTTVDGKTFTVQRFERNRLELHPENARPYDVLLGRLGADRLGQQGRDWFGFSKSPATNGCRAFVETGHAVCGAILNAWRSNGLQIDGNKTVSEAESLALFGMPLSGLMTETLNGKQYQVQWFERARFELHPENIAPYDVLLGLLGSEDTAFRSKPAPTAVPQATAVPQPTAIPTPDTTSILGTAELNARRRSMPNKGYWTSTFDQITIAVGSFLYLPTIRYSDAPNGMKYVTMSVTLRNDRPRGGDTRFVNGAYFSLIDLEGRIYDTASAMYSLDNSLEGATVVPGTRTGGQLAFLIPADTAPAQLYVDFYAMPMTIELRTRPQQ
jgi:hypothetical protein